MEKVKLCCNVCSCCHNENGKECSKDKISITNDRTEQTAHYCADYEE